MNRVLCEKLKAYYDKIRDTKSRFSGDEEDAAFEETILSLSPGTMQKILGVLDFEDLANILSCASGRLQMLLLDNVHKRAAATLINEIEDRVPISKEMLKSSQKCVLNIIDWKKKNGKLA